jgi:hypothetical protein
MSWRPPRHRAARSPGRPGGSPGQQPNVCNGQSGPDAPPSEMPRFSRQDQLTSAPDELILDMLLDRGPPPPEAPPQMAALLPMLADLSGPAEPGELAVEAAVLSRFRSRIRPPAISGTAPRPSRRTSRWHRLIPHSPRVCAALAAAAITLAGTAAAYAGALPPPLQDLAHHAIDAPAARHASRQGGHGPRHQQGITQPGTASPGRRPQSATSGTANHHTQPGHDAATGRAAHPAEPRPSAETSPQPGQARHSGQPLHTSRPPQASQPPHTSGLQASRPPHPGDGPRESLPPQASGQARGGPPSGEPATPARPPRAKPQPRSSRSAPGLHRGRGRLPGAPALSRTRSTVNEK